MNWQKSPQNRINKRKTSNHAGCWFFTFWWSVDKKDTKLKKRIHGSETSLFKHLVEVCPVGYNISMKLVDHMGFRRSNTGWGWLYPKI